MDELEEVTWGEPPYDSSLVQTCHRLRKKPIGKFSVEDLRIMIGQQIGLFFLVPIALEVLEKDPLAEGDCYPGDLLNSAMNIDSTFWQRHMDWKTRFDNIIGGMSEIPWPIEESVERYKNIMT